MTNQRIFPRAEHAGPGASSAMPLWMRLFFALQRRIYGAVLEPMRVWARAPAAMCGSRDPRPRAMRRALVAHRTVACVTARSRPFDARKEATLRPFAKPDAEALA
jgi:hypothetical protein